jgi:hypothetical protein
VGLNPTDELTSRNRLVGHSWPFMAAKHVHGSQVTAEGVGIPTHQKIEFKDGSCIWLHRVVKGGSPDLFLRDLGEPAAGTRIDLRALIPACEKELPITSTRDVAGFIQFSLRGQFASCDDFLRAIARTPRPA